MIDTTKPDIIFDTESWLTSEVKDNEVFPPGYNIFRNDRETTVGGGVFLGINSDFICSSLPELGTDCEIVWAKIQFHGQKLVHLASYYRPHVDNESSLTELSLSLDKISNPSNAVIIIGGDMNLPGWDWKNKCVKEATNHPGFHYYFANILNDNNLEQMVEEPTRGSNTLDLFCTNAPGRVNRTHTLPGISDHDCVYMEIDINPIRPRQKKRPVPLYKKADWQGLAETILQSAKEMETKKDTVSTDTLWESFKEAMTQGIMKFIPHKSIKPLNGFPWITQDIKRLMSKRDRLYSKKKNTGCAKLDKQFRALKHQIQREVRKAYWSYVEDIITPLDDEKPYQGMKRFWSMMKHLRSDNSGIAPLRDNGQLFTAPKEKANILNRQFESVFTRECELTDDILPASSPHSSAPEINITEPGVLKLLLKLQPHKAAGPDTISPRVLKEVAHAAVPALTTIFQHSLKFGNVPSDWRTAHVAPIYKKGQKYVAANHCPVSLKCIASNLMEHIVTSAIMDHANANNILYDLQHSFRQQRS